MSIKFPFAHIVQSGDSRESIVARYRLSSWRAVTEISPNIALRELTESHDDLPVGLLIHIPPNAPELARERLYGLHSFRPEIMVHFDAMQELCNTELRGPVLAAADPLESEEIRQALARLHSYVAEATDILARNTSPLIQVCQGMIHTHVAERTDHAVVNAGGDPLRGLYWAVTPSVLELWKNMWAPGTWAAKWRSVASKAAWEQATQYATTIRSLVVQQIDRRIREAMALERALRLETDQH
ncbi:MAG: hypothetical protein OEM51_00215 [Gammaproteobacteria bacterium]|nr:hypothetical protein [Gammaproteobacteria bacterium]MDH3431232.1 hypothetical protein [Gammaproteobacteria bacterium]